MAEAALARTLATERRYSKRGAQLILAWRRVVPDEERNTASAFVAWLLERGRQLRGASFRQYRAATLQAMPHAFAPGEDLERAMEKLRMARHQSAATLERRTSARKLRFITLEDWLALSEFLLSRDAAVRRVISPRSGVEGGRVRHLVTDALVEAWCRATLLCGLRPVEWFGAELASGADGSLSVVVRNAKGTHERSHGETRTLVFENLPPSDRDALGETIASARAAATSGYQEEMQKLLADRLYRSARRALGDRDAYPSFYTFRHQAIANWKAERDAVEVAALCGHAMIETSAKHYAGRRRAWLQRRPSVPRASMVDLAAVLSRQPPKTLRRDARGRQFRR